ncbi:hypothetical protein ACHAXH_003986, partial [Discostella pseudostelligera]
MDMDSPPDPSAAPHPDSAIRLASTIHRFSIPFIDPGDQLSFETSFKTCSAGHQSTTSVLVQADHHRHAIKKMSHWNNRCSLIIAPYSSKLTLLNVQPNKLRIVPDLAGTRESRTIERSKSSSLFPKHSWTYALSESNIGCDACVSGNFPEASRQFSKTAGIFQYLSEDLLPNWMAKSKQHAEMEKESLAETRVGVCVAFTSLYMAMSQQMAVATILIKPGVPNYSLVGKLCLGIAEEFETFVSTLRSKSPMHLDRIDPAFLTLITFCINVQRALSLYFLARSLWIASEYGVAIAALDEATIAMRVRTSPEKRGLPEMEEKGPLSALVGEVNGFRLHMSTLMKSWERDNLLVYFDK